MNIITFILAYWGAQHRNGSPWTPADIAVDSGLDLNTINYWLSWCRTNGSGLSAQELVAVFQTNWQMVPNPFGPGGFSIAPLPAPSSGTTPTLAGLIADLKTVISRYGG